MSWVYCLKSHRFREPRAVGDYSKLKRKLFLDRFGPTCGCLDEDIVLYNHHRNAEDATCGETAGDKIG